MMRIMGPLVGVRMRIMIMSWHGRYVLTHTHTSSLLRESKMVPPQMKIQSQLVLSLFFLDM